MCTGILEKVVNSPNWDMKDHCDTKLIWRTTYLKCLSTIQLLASEGYLIELVLGECKCGEPFTMLVCTPFMCKLSRFYNQLITLHV
jgi:hypothetical protein